MYLCNEECNVNHVLRVLCNEESTTKACPGPPGQRRQGASKSALAIPNAHTQDDATESLSLRSFKLCAANAVLRHNA